MSQSRPSRSPASGASQSYEQRAVANRAVRHAFIKWLLEVVVFWTAGIWLAVAVPQSNWIVVGALAVFLAGCAWTVRLGKLLARLDRPTRVIRYSVITSTILTCWSVVIVLSNSSTTGVAIAVGTYALIVVLVWLLGTAVLAALMGMGSAIEQRRSTTRNINSLGHHH